MPERERVAADDAWRVRIRMYRLGIGDCFLLSFTAADRSHHVLIDCGILQGSPSATQRIRKVAENVAAVTGNRLDVLVATHEHWDHVSGFHDARDIFDAMQVDQVWVAWTENTRDAAAARLKEEKRQRLQALRMALAELALADSAEAQDVGGAIAQTLGFYGGPAAVDEGSPFAFSEKTDLAMRAVTERSGGPLPTFCEPGDLMTPAWDDGMRVYVLGPPCDPERIRDLRAKAGADIYALAGADGLYVSALGAAARARSAGADDQQDEISDDRSFPFHPSMRWQGEADIRQNRKLQKLVDRYEANGASWRRIDFEWLVSSARMALQLDDATNNTSLVLAFELGDGRVLLFPGDAQIGSWKSWLDIAWTAEKAKRSTAIASRDLLQRTVFYKVRHHGSENATRKEDGLEAMIDRRLVAAIPVDQEFANFTKKWRMPAEALSRRLSELTEGRVVRADAAWKEPDAQPPAGVSPADWQHFRDVVQPDPRGLFIDYLLR